MSNILAWICAVVVAGFFIMLGINKFTNAPITMWIFHEVAEGSGIALFEPYGRLATGAAELAAAALLLVAPVVLTLMKNGGRARKAQAWGAALGLAVTLGAILSHLAFLGVMTPADAQIVDGAPAPLGERTPALFMIAVGLAAGSALIAFFRRRDFTA